MTTSADRPIVGVGVLALDDQGRMLLIQRAHEPQKGKWAVPGGKVEPGESMRDTAAREVLEETGLVVEPGEVVWVGEIIEPGFHMVLIDYAGRVVGGHLDHSDDAADVRWVTPEEARSLPLTPTMIEMLDTLRL
jgi:8-oxo-dGTP diphosphatase